MCRTKQNQRRHNFDREKFAVMSEVMRRRSRRTTSPSKGDLKEQALLTTARRLLDEARFADVSVGSNS